MSQASTTDGLTATRHPAPLCASAEHAIADGLSEAVTPFRRMLVQGHRRGWRALVAELTVEDRAVLSKLVISGASGAPPSSWAGQVSWRRGFHPRLCLDGMRMIFKF